MGDFETLRPRDSLSGNGYQMDPAVSCSWTMRDSSAAVREHLPQFLPFGGLPHARLPKSH